MLGSNVTRVTPRHVMGEGRVLAIMFEHGYGVLPCRRGSNYTYLLQFTANPNDAYLVTRLVAGSISQRGVFTGEYLCIGIVRGRKLSIVSR